MTLSKYWQTGDELFETFYQHCPGYGANKQTQSYTLCACPKPVVFSPLYVLLLLLKTPFNRPIIAYMPTPFYSKAVGVWWG